MPQTMKTAAEFHLHPLHPACVEIATLREQLAEAKRQMGRPLVVERGPWSACWGSRANSYGGTTECAVLSSEDFTHDVWLFVAGDFEGQQQQMDYANELARRLNAGA